MMIITRKVLLTLPSVYSYPLTCLKSSLVTRTRRILPLVVTIIMLNPILLLLVVLLIPLITTGIWHFAIFHGRWQRHGRRMAKALPSASRWQTVCLKPCRQRLLCRLLADGKEPVALPSAGRWQSLLTGLAPLEG